MNPKDGLSPSERPSFARQKATFRTPKGHLLQAERRPFAKPLIINGFAVVSLNRNV